jgi:hypothetical protein
MNLKVVVNNRNRLTTTRNMVEHLLRLNPRQEIVILDNASTYPPLMEWYQSVNENPERWPTLQIRLLPNLGHLAFWNSNMQGEVGEYFVYSDSDIELDPEMPHNWALQMINLIEKYEINKVGLSIRIDDIPDHYPHKSQVLRDQAGCWKEEAEPNVFWGDTDTTFCLIRNVGGNPYRSLRVARKGFKSRHTPFYLDFEDLSPEELYVLDNHDGRFHTQYTSAHVREKKKTNPHE